MKKALWLLTIAVALTACHKDPPANPDQNIGTIEGVGKVLVLNEGQMGSNNSTLDLISCSDGTYKNNVFKGTDGQGLGDVGNDIVINGDELWIVVNNSGIVEVLNKDDLSEIAVIKVATPRSIAFDENYAYVSSWAGAYAVFGEDWSVTDYKNPKGCVYRIDLKTKEIKGSVEVGYQPEGLAVSGDKLYVANSGGISYNVTFTYDNTVSVIDTKSFSVSKTIEVAVNLNKVYADSKGLVYVTSLGDFYSLSSGLYTINQSGEVFIVDDYVSVSAFLDDCIYWIGNKEEFDYAATERTWKAFKCTNGDKEEIQLDLDGVKPFGLCALGGGQFLISDAGDYVNPGTVSLFRDGKKVKTVTAGVSPGHFAILK